LPEKCLKMGLTFIKGSNKDKSVNMIIQAIFALETKLVYSDILRSAIHLMRNTV
jgi:hypothetical protein